jgi:uncharacterized protein
MTQQLQTIGSWTPVAEHERYLTLDVLRGLAVFGILLANILAYGYPGWEGTGVWTNIESPLDTAVIFGISIVVSGKFYTIFSILFGMGLALQNARAKSRGTPFVGTYSRRLLFLVLFGVVHGVFLFSADILAFYAIVGFAALLFRNSSSKRLVTIAVALFAVSMVVLVLSISVKPDLLNRSEPDWEMLAEARRVELETTAGDESFRAEEIKRDRKLRLYRFMAENLRVYRSGTWLEMVLHRAVIFFLVGMPLRLGLVFWRCLPLFLMGIFFFRKGLFLDNEQNRMTYKRMLGWGLGLGLLLQLIAGAVQMGGGTGFTTHMLLMAGVIFGPLGIALAYCGGVALLCLRENWHRRLSPLAAVGRMALTNYVGHSVLCGFVFTGFGLGLYGQLSPTETFLIALLVFATQLVISPIWLRRFRFGPLEYLWRRLTYRRIQPMKKS